MGYLPLFPMFHIPEVYGACNAGLYYIHVRRLTCGDTVMKKFLYF